MEFTQKITNFLENKEPANKYGVHFEYQDLFQRLLLVKRQQERHANTKIFISFDKDPKIFKSFDKDTKKSPPSRSSSKNKSRNSIRSTSVQKNPRRGISSDFMKLFKVYSPANRKAVQTPEKLLRSYKVPSSLFVHKVLKKRIVNPKFMQK